MGFPCDKQELKDLVQEYIQSNRIQSRFQDGRPGEDWYLAFMKRNPAITLKKPEHLQKARKKARDPFVVYQFFGSVKKVYMSSHIDENCGRLIFNADESGFANDPSRLRAIGEKGKPLQRVSDGSGRDATTVLACISASGDALPPLIVFKGLFPLDEAKIPEDLFDPQDLARYRQRRSTAEKVIASSHSASENDKERIPDFLIPDITDMVDDECFSRGEIVPFNDEDSNVALDLTMPLRKSDLEDEQAPSTSHTVNDMVSIFSKSISKTTFATKSPVKTGTGTRLKHQTYGEVLTTDDVLLRLREAQEKKATKVTKRKKSNECDGKKNEKPKKAKKPSAKEADSESEEEEELQILESDGEEEEEMDWDSYLKNMEEEQLEEVTYIEPRGVNILPNTFVMVEIMGGKRGKTKYCYLCRVDKVSNELEVTGLKSVNSRKSKFKLVENDQFSVEWDQIKAILPTPQIEKDGRREIYKFSGTVNVTEM
ncbi:hypothetical protein GE061_018527 [Apolygus lucorum]|nr:hypothetical protein GE061_018527 [Apolygus lucorum]